MRWGTAGTALSELSGIMIVVKTAEFALPDDYPHLLAELKAQIRSAQWTAARVVNTTLIEYWAIGKAILDRQKDKDAGDVLRLVLSTPVATMAESTVVDSTESGIVGGESGINQPASSERH